MLLRLTNIAIVAFWLVMMFSLVKDKILPRASAQRTTVVDVPELVLEWEDVEEAFHVKSEGRSIGATYLSIVETSMPIGYKADFGFIIKLTVLRKSLVIIARGEAQLDHLFYLESFIVNLDALSVSLKAAGTMDDEKRLYMKIVPSEGDPLKFVVQFDKHLSFLEAVRPIAFKQLELQIGQSYEIDVIDPVGVMRRGKLVLTIEGRDILLEDDGEGAHEVFVATSTFAGMETKVWIDTKTGNVLKRQLLPNRSVYLIRDLKFTADSPKRGHMASLEREIERVEIGPEEFDGIEPKTMEEIYEQYADDNAFAGIFKSLNNIVPETQK